MSKSRTTTSPPGDLAQMRRAPTHPGTILADMLREGHLTQAEAARRMGMSTVRLNEIRLGKRGMTAETCVRVAALTSTSPEFWGSLQMRRDLWHAMQADGKAVSAIEPMRLAVA